MPSGAPIPKVLGSSDAVHPGAYLLGGVLCLAVAYLMGTDGPRRGVACATHCEAPGHVGQGGAEQGGRALGGDRAALAFAVGAVINVPGIYYLSALHDMATGGYSNAEQITLIVLFNLVMFALVEPARQLCDLAGEDCRTGETFPGSSAEECVPDRGRAGARFGIALVAKGIAALA
jgi:hypothetical protein